MNRAAWVLIGCAAVTGCTAEPRSATYFAAHLDVARAVGAECQSGARRGPECENALVGLAAAARDARMRDFHKAF